MPAAAILWRSHQQLPATAIVNRSRRRLRRQLPAASAGELPADAAGGDAWLLPAVQWIPVRAGPAAAEPGPAVVPVVLPAHQPDRGDVVGVLTGHGWEVEDHGWRAAPSVLTRSSTSCTVESFCRWASPFLYELVQVVYFVVLICTSA